MKKGFTVVEILISMMVLFIAISLVNISIKTFNNYQKKSKVYQNLYMTVLSLKDWISSLDSDQTHYEGVINSINYTIDLKLLIKEKNYMESMELGDGNNGDFLVSLYNVTMVLKYKNKEENYNFLLTKQKSLFK